MPALIGDMHLPAYLSTLQEVHDVERRLPVTIPPAKQRTARQRPYHLSDPCMRFYVRFIHPQHDIASYAPERILPALQSGLRAFVGQTVWEDVARQWVGSVATPARCHSPPRSSVATGVDTRKRMWSRSTGQRGPF